MVLLIDALNVSYWCGSPPTLRLPLGLLIGALVAGHDAQLVFDASAPYRLSADADAYRELLRYPSRVTVVASGRSADAVLLRQARSGGAIIISNDRYRDHRRRYRTLIDDAARLLTGRVQDDRIEVPTLALTVPLPASLQPSFDVLNDYIKQGNGPPHAQR